MIVLEDNFKSAVRDVAVAKSGDTEVTIKSIPAKQEDFESLFNNEGVTLVCLSENSTLRWLTNVPVITDVRDMRRKHSGTHNHQIPFHYEGGMFVITEKDSEDVDGYLIIAKDVIVRKFPEVVRKLKAERDAKAVEYCKELFSLIEVMLTVGVYNAEVRVGNRTQNLTFVAKDDDTAKATLPGQIAFEKTDDLQRVLDQIGIITV